MTRSRLLTILLRNSDNLAFILFLLTVAMIFIFFGR